MLKHHGFRGLGETIMVLEGLGDQVTVGARPAGQVGGPAAPPTRTVEEVKQLIKDWPSMSLADVTAAKLPTHVQLASGDKEVWLIHPRLVQMTVHSSGPGAGEPAKWKDSVEKAKPFSGGPSLNWSFMMYSGTFPYEVFINTADGKRWGKFYGGNPKNVRTYQQLVIKPYPPHDDVFDKIGKSIVKGLKWVFQKLKDLLSWICKQLNSPLGQMGANVLASSFGAPPGTGAAIARGAQAAGQPGPMKGCDSCGLGEEPPDNSITKTSKDAKTWCDTLFGSKKSAPDEGLGLSKAGFLLPAAIGGGLLLLFFGSKYRVK